MSRIANLGGTASGRGTCGSLLRVPFLLCLLLLLVSSSVRADTGDAALSLSGGYVAVDGAELLGGVDVGLGRWFALRTRVGVRGTPRHTGLSAELGALFVYDVLIWVPEVLVAAATRSSAFDEFAVGAVATLGIRRYLGLDDWIAVEAGGEWIDGDANVLLRATYAF